jgi:adenylate kinase
MNQSLDHVIEMRVNDDVLVSGSSTARKRPVPPGKPVRADDNEESLRIRLGAYYKQTSPLIGYYYAKVS